MKIVSASFLLPYYQLDVPPYIKGLSPFEIIYGRPPPLLPKLGEEALAELSNHYLKSLQALQLIQQKNHQMINNCRTKPSPPGNTDLHDIKLVTGCGSRKFSLLPLNLDGLGCYP